MGLVKQDKGYSLQWDSLALSRHVGENAGLFTREYDMKRTTRLARMNRKRCTELTPADMRSMGMKAEDDYRYIKVEI